MGTPDRVLDRPVLDHQPDGAIEISVGRFAALERAPPEFALGIAAAAEREHDRQGNLALAKIVADVLAEPRRHAAIIERIVDELKGDAEIHSVGAARRLLRLLPSGYSGTDLARGGKQFGGLGADHGD